MNFIWCASWFAYLHCFSVQLMVLKVDGNLKIGGHEITNLCYLTCLRHSIRSRTVINRIFFSKNIYFQHACAPCSELPSNISIMAQLFFQYIICLQIIFSIFPKQKTLQSDIVRNNALSWTKLAIKEYDKSYNTNGTPI